MGFFDGLKSDWAFAAGIFRAMRLVTPMARNRTRTFPDALEDLARRYGGEICECAAAWSPR